MPGVEQPVTPTRLSLNVNGPIVEASIGEVEATLVVTPDPEVPCRGQTTYTITELTGPDTGVGWRPADSPGLLFGLWTIVPLPALLAFVWFRQRRRWQGTRRTSGGGCLLGG